MVVSRRTVLAFAASAPFGHWVLRRRPPKRKPAAGVYSDTYSNTY